MGKLKLKRTSEEQAAHDLRKAQKRARKAAKRQYRNVDGSSDEDEPRKKHQTSYARTEYGYMFDEGESSAGPSHRAHKPDYENIQAQVEEERFREKLWGAFGDDERLDSVEASLNSYAHIPRRWRSGGMDKIDDEVDIDPQMMEEEDYAEWMRAAMWKKKHAAEFAEQERQKQERAARHEREKKLREQTAKMEKAEHERRKQKHTMKERNRWEDARVRYEVCWKQLLSTAESSQDDRAELCFEDIPWPALVMDVGPSLGGKDKCKTILEVDDINMEAVTAFLLPGGRLPDSSTKDEEIIKKERRDKLRETMLRFHPDKFEGRIMSRIRESDKEAVREAVGRVARVINDLLAGK
ncbi:hypothetical protein BDY19DRAFT_904888 [Irpex rosettiformis]|uniref:Uncharacterized protein n=1 Tax=Irpex rosettiformis TaxID=378272 RepID=A0ACB8U8H8_9APHY|nr:hypothetical protein BDY19DRAFT_904888 [Irpex rosettiformis]